LRRTHHYLDVKEHLRILHRQVMPIFFVLCSFAMVLFIVIRAGQEGATLPDRAAIARIGLLSPEPDAPFDPAFAVFSPVELVLAPSAVVFDPAPSTETIRAVADGRVVFAGESGGSPSVVLIHERKGEIVETRYPGLTSVRVAVAGQVRRGDVIGTLAEGKAGTFRFARRHFPALAVEGVPGESGSIPEDWRGRAPGRISPPPTGEPIEPGALKLESKTPPLN